MLIRKARKADKQAVNELRKQLKLLHAAGRPDFFTNDFSGEAADYVDVLFMQENVDILVAENNGVIVGFACVEYIDRPAAPYRVACQYCHIMEFGVDDRHRRQGIGRALFEGIKAQAQEKGFQRIDLGVWEFNEDAIRFYESIGFKSYKRQMEYQ